MCSSGRWLYCWSSPGWFAARIDEENTEMQSLNRWKTNLRIVLAIAAKDILDALKSRTTLGIMIGVVILMTNGHLLPLLLGLRDQPKAAFYDPGRSQLVRSLVSKDQYVLVFVDSLEEMGELVADSAEVWLGIALPEDFDQLAGSGEQIELPGYSVYWADPGLLAERAAFFEALLGKASWQTVRINLELGGALYPAPDSTGWSYMLALVLTITILTMGVVLAPHLLVEEKERHTLEVLLVSPASYSQVIAGKAIAGAFYCLVAAVVVMAFDARYIVHWGMLSLGVLLGIGCAVSIGLFFGVYSDSGSTVNVWAGLGLGVLIVPAFLQFFANSGWPGFVQAILSYIPSAALARLVRSSMAGDVQAGLLSVDALILVLWSLFFFGLILRQLKRIDR
jgi:ABC-2 type transport system permease protein